MAVPTITTITPNAGLSSGQTLVEIVGTAMRLPPSPPESGPTDGYVPITVNVLFAGLRATNVNVRTDPSNPPDGTIVSCLTPPHEPGIVDFTLRNLDDSGDPIPGEEVVAVGAFTYHPEDLTREADLTRLVRTLLREFKAQVMENVSLTVSTDYDDTPEDQLHIAAVSELPTLVLVGPQLSENRFYSLNQLPESGGGDAEQLPFYIQRSPYTVDLSFTIIGISDHTVQLLNLMSLCTMFFHKNKFIKMDRDPSNPIKGEVAYEMDFEPDGQLKVQSQPNESNVRHFTGTFVIRGFDIDQVTGIAIEEGRTNGPITLDTQHKGS